MRKARELELELLREAKVANEKDAALRLAKGIGAAKAAADGNQWRSKGMIAS